MDGDGRVIGINQQIKTTSGGGEGVGFAVPIDAVKRSLDELRETGRGATTPTSASSSVELYPQLVDQLRPRRRQGRVGAGGHRRRPGRDARASAAAAARSRSRRSRYRPGGDVITKVEGKPVEDSADLADADRATSSRATRSRSRSTATATRRQIKVKLGRAPARATSRG